MAVKKRSSFFQMPGDKHVRREWVYQLLSPIPIWVWQKWHMIDDSNARMHVDGREIFPGDKLIFENGEFIIVRK